MKTLFTITNMPKPGVAPIGTSYAFALGVKGDRIEFLQARREDGETLRYTVDRNAQDFDEIIIVEGTITYRVWKQEHSEKVA